MPPVRNPHRRQHPVQDTIHVYVSLMHILCPPLPHLSCLFLLYGDDGWTDGPSAASEAERHSFQDFPRPTTYHNTVICLTETGLFVL